jgi:enoyl-CoA hydratase/carnithine racemase
MIRRIMGARRLPSDADRDVVSMCYASRDFREGVEAFVAKRRPSWTGS